MSRRLVFLEVLAALLLASCGSSSHPTTASTPGQTAAPGPTGTGTSTAVTGTTATTGTAPGPGPGTPGSTGAAPGPGQEKIRLPANFTVRAGGTLNPRSISSPAFLAISLSVASADGKAHRVVLRTPKPHTLNLPAGGRASALIRGLPPGRYLIFVDGAARGALNIGGEPGP